MQFCVFPRLIRDCFWENYAAILARLKVGGHCRDQRLCLARFVKADVDKPNGAVRS